MRQEGKETQVKDTAETLHCMTSIHTNCFTMAFYNTDFLK